MTTGSHAQTVLSDRWKWASGQAISFLMQQAIENRRCLSLAAGLVDPTTLPVAVARDALADLFSDDATARAVLQYGTTPGVEPARQAIRDHFLSLEAETGHQPELPADRVVLSTGSQQLLSILGEILLNPGDICFVAAPTYFVFLSVLEGLGARAVPVRADGDGMCPNDLQAQIEHFTAQGLRDRIKLVYLVSYYDNPSAVSLSEERRGRIVGIVREASREQQVYILEDAAYRELRYSGPNLPSVWSHDPAGEHVVYTQTFSKSFSPGVRVGFGVLPQALLGPVLDRKGNEDFGSANLNQRLIANVLASGKYLPHVESVRAAYLRKRDAIVAAADEFLAPLPGVRYTPPDGGLYLWVELPESIPTGFDSDLFKEATCGDGVMYVPGALAFAAVDGVKPDHHMRLSFGVLPEDQIREAVRRLGRAIATVAEQTPEEPINAVAER